MRYADDMILLAQKELETGIALLEPYLERLGLSLNREKTRKLRMEQGASVEFLGFRFFYTKSRKTGTRLILVSPSPLESATLSREDTHTRSSLDSIADERTNTERESVFTWLGRLLSSWTQQCRAERSYAVCQQACATSAPTAAGQTRIWLGRTNLLRLYLWHTRALL
ncbi:MAG: hypothetical protein C4326_12615 [Ignavibacteria bacterium]